MAVTGQEWNFKRGQDARLALVGVDTTDPSLWTLGFTLTEYDGAETATYTYTPTVTGPNSGVYTLNIYLTRAQTLELLNPLTDGYQKQYTWDVWRQDTGTQVPLASGTTIVSNPSRLAS
jgi:hypothetical protein